MPPEVDPKAPKANPVDAPKVDEVAKQTEDKLTSEGVHAAYTELRGTIGKYRSDLDASDGKKDGNLNADAGKSFKQFQTDLNREIVDRNLAPDLSIAWAKEAKTRLDFNNSDSIDSAEVRGHVKDTDQFTQLMGKSFAQQLDDGKISSSDTYKPTSLTGFQLDSALQDRTGDRRRSIAESENLKAEQTNAKADESVLQSMVPKRGNAEAVKLFDVLDASGGKDGAFNKQDVEQVLKLSSVYGLESKQEAFLKNLNDNWDQKGGLRLREKAENGYADDKITNDSIQTATGEKARLDKANAASDDVLLQAARARAQEGSRADVDFLTKHFVGKDSDEQKSLFDVADLISGDNPNGEVTREEIKKTIDNADVLQLSAEEKSFLTRVHDGWDSDNGVVRLRTEGTGNDAVV
ncbi:MAG: hypothetical protein IAF58_17220, partial [Leptolyngbya sp.]|nr:hypothetical protein [Candidatus Melainabacteria bacterium]